MYKTQTTINASPEQVWDALVNPDKISQYMFGSITESDWKAGDEIKFYFEQGDHRVLAVHGKITAIDAPKVLEHTLFPTASEIEDIPENYLTVRYEIEPVPGGSSLSIKQDGFDGAANGEQRYQEVVEGWKVIIPKLKEIAEEQV